MKDQKIRITQTLIWYADEMGIESVEETIRLCFLRINNGEADVTNTDYNTSRILTAHLIRLNREKGTAHVNNLVAEIMAEIVSIHGGFDYAYFVEAGVMALPAYGAIAIPTGRYADQIEAN